MTQRLYDPHQAVTFDLGRGSIHLDDTVSRVLIPAEALSELAQCAGSEASRHFGRQLGTEIGRRLSDRLADELTPASVATIVEHLGGDLALVGFGSLGVERWGRALVLTVSKPPFGPAGDELLASIFEGALQRALARDVRAVPLSREDSEVRLLIVNETTAEVVAKWLAEDVSWGDVLARLHDSAEGSDDE